MNNKPNVFWTKNKIIYFSIFFIITIVLLSLTVVFILNIDINKIFNDIGNGLKITDYQFVFLIILLIFPIIRAICYINYYYLFLRKEKIYLSAYEWFFLGFVTVFIISITPSSIGSEPFIIYFLNRKVKNLKKTSATVLCSSLIGQCTSIFVTLPSFIWYCAMVNYQNLDMQNNTAFWFLLIGIFMDFVVLVSFIILGFTKKIHYWTAIIFHKIKKLLKLKYKTNSEIEKEIVENAEFKNEVLKQFKNIKISIITFVLFVLYNILYYVCVYFSMTLINGVATLNFWEIFNYTNIATTANNFIPIPGSEGTLQWLLKILLANSVTDVELLNNSIFIWRFFTTQLTTLIGLLFIVVEIAKYYITKKRKTSGVNHEKL